MNANAEIIKQNISMYDVLLRYGFKTRRGSVCCPFHNEKTPSFKVYQNGKKFHCFGCGMDGDVINFAMKYYGIKYGQAITRLASEFGIFLPEGRPSLKERVQIQETRLKRKQEEEFTASEEDRLHKEWLSACDRVIELKEVIKKNAPKKPSDLLPDVYCYALKMLPYFDYLCEMKEIELRNFEERRRPVNERDNQGPAIHKGGLSERARAV